MTFISRWAEKHRKLNIQFTMIVVPTQFSLLKLIIEISNPSFRDVTINAPYLKLPALTNIGTIVSSSLVLTDPHSNVEFPHRLVEGSKCWVWTDWKCLAQNLSGLYSGIIEIYAVVEDGAGNKYQSPKPWKLNMDKLELLVPSGLLRDSE